MKTMASAPISSRLTRSELPLFFPTQGGRDALTAAAGVAAVDALVAGTVAHHDASASRARGRIVQRVHRPEIIQGARRCASIALGSGISIRNVDARASLLIGSQKLRSQPAEDVTTDRFRVRNFRVTGVSRRFKADVRELVDQHLERNAVLQRE